MGTRGCRWVIGQAGVIKCMYEHTFYDPCLSDHLQPRVSIVKQPYRERQLQRPSTRPVFTVESSVCGGSRATLPEKPSDAAFSNSIYFILSEPVPASTVLIE